MSDSMLYPVPIDTSNQTFDYKEGATIKSVVVPVGEYYSHNDASKHAQYPSIYITLKGLLDAAGALTFTFAEATPTQSSEQTLAGLAITADGAWELGRFSDLHKTGVLGFAQTSGYEVADVANTVTSDFTLGGVWVSPEQATDKRADFDALLAHSTMYAELEDHYVLNRGERALRTLIYDYILAGHIHATRGNDAGYAEAAGLGVGDVFNACELLWRQWAKGKSIIINHNRTSQNLLIENYEVIRCANPNDARLFSRAFELLRMGGEYYRVRLPSVIVDAGDYVGQ